MAVSSKKMNPLWYVIIAVNILPVIAVTAGIVALPQIAYFYWAECALAGILAVAMYARYLIAFFLMTAAIGIIVYLANPLLLENIKSIILFWSLYAICWICYVEIGRSRYGQHLRKLKPSEQLVIYLGFLTVSLIFCTVLTITLSGGRIDELIAPTFYLTFIWAAILVPTISTGILKVVDMIGQKHFVDFIMGTYHVPVEHKRIVLFLDMVGSSAMAERLEPQQSMKLIAEYIYDCGYIFRIHGGDILNYTGDGLVVLWNRDQSNAALSAVYKLRNHFASKGVRATYWKKYGMVPDFRIGMHAGLVVLSQIGEEKLFIGLYGDVVNTAARLEQMNKELGTSILVSSAVVQGLNQSWKTLLKPLGEKEVRGRKEKIAVYTIYQDV